MPDSPLPAAIQALGTNDILDYVRQDQNDPAFEITSWKAQSLGHTIIIETTGGLYRFSGAGLSLGQEKEWRILLKIVNNPKTWGQEPSFWAYWKREPQLFQTRVLSTLPSSIKTPRFYGLAEQETCDWLWMEFIEECTSKHWQIEDYQTPAYHAGQYAGAYLTGAYTIPQSPWMSERFFHNIFHVDDWWKNWMNPSAEKNAWQSALVQKYFSEEQKQAVLQLWAEKFRFFDTIDHLPQIFCHHDFSRRNILLRLDEDGRSETVAIDWAFGGPGAVGSDLGQLVGTSAYFIEFPHEQYDNVETLVLESYLAGLNDSGWHGDPRLPRLGYLCAVSLWWAGCIAGWAAILQDSTDEKELADRGVTIEEEAEIFSGLQTIYLKRADEARRLMSELGM